MVKNRFYINSVLFSVLCGCLGVWVLLNSPYLGLYFEKQDDKWILKKVDGPAERLSILIGSQIININGYPVMSETLIEDFDYIPDANELKRWWHAQSYFSKAIQIGKPVKLTLKKDNVSYEKTIIPEKYPPLKLLKTNLPVMYSVGLITIILALLVVLKRPDDERSQIFFIFAFVVSLMDFTFGSYTSRNISFDINIFTLFRILNGIGYCLFPAVFLHFVLIFPSSKKSEVKKRLIILFYCLSVILAVIYQLRISYLSLNLMFLFSLLSGIFIMTRRYYQSRSALEKAQLKWILISTVAFATTFIATAYGPILFSGVRIASDVVPTYVFLLIPISIAISITKYRLIEIDNLLDNTLIYGITLSLLAAVDIVLVATLSELSTKWRFLDRPIPEILAVWFAVVLYVPVREKVKIFIKRLLRGRVYDLATEITRFSNLVMRSKSIDSIIEGLIKCIKKNLQPKFVTLSIVDNKRGVQKIIGKDDGTVRQIISMIINNHNEDVARIADLADYQDIPYYYRAGLFAKLKSSGETYGYIVVSEDKNSRLYTNDDIRLLKALTNQAALGIEKIRLYLDRAEKEQAFLREKNHLSMEIHDGISTELASIIAYVEKGTRLLEAEKNKIPGLIEVLNKIDEISRRGLREIRNLIWATTQDIEVKDFFSYLRRFTVDLLESKDINVKFIKSNLNSFRERLSSQIRLTILRVFQEICANIIKHSGASCVEIQINMKDDNLLIRVLDNGKGFDLTEIVSGRGLGNIKRRLSEIKASLHMSSETNKGTKIEIQIPLKN